MIYRVLMLSVILIFAIFPASAQENTPAYALAFHAGDEVRVAVFDGNRWEVQALPNFMLFGQYDISLVLPEWTAGGQLIGVGYEPEVGAHEPAEGGAAAYLYRYDVQTLTMETLPQPIGTVTSDSFMPPTLAISSISPDGRYATLYDVLGLTGHLVDFDTQQVLFTLDTCGLKAFHWTETSVFVGSHAAYIACPPAFYEIELASGEVLTDMSALFTGQDITVFDKGYWLGGSDFLLAVYGMETYYKVIRLNPEGAYIIAPLVDQLVISESRQGAAFTNYREGNEPSSLTHLNLESMEITELADVSNVQVLHFEGETLHYAAALSTDDLTWLFTGSFSPGTEPATTLLYEGTTPELELFSPTGEQVALIVDKLAQVYDQSGLVWSSAGAGYDHLDANGLRWSADGQWLYVYYVEVTLAANLQTEEIIAPPEQHAQFLSASPDGRWWLYIVREPGDDGAMYQSERLFVYDPQTQELVTLSDDAALYDNFHWSLESLFVWSPLIEK